jgi:integrase
MRKGEMLALTWDDIDLKKRLFSKRLLLKAK